MKCSQIYQSNINYRLTSFNSLLHDIAIWQQSLYLIFSKRPLHEIHVLLWETGAFTSRDMISDICWPENLFPLPLSMATAILGLLNGKNSITVYEHSTSHFTQWSTDSFLQLKVDETKDLAIYTPSRLYSPVDAPSAHAPGSQPEI